MKMNKQRLSIVMICLLVVVNSICYQSVWGKSYQEENYQGVLEVAQWEPGEEHSEAIPELTPEPTPTPNVGNGSNNPIVSAPTPKPIPTPTTELVPTIVPAPTETTVINQNEQITGVKVVPVNMGRTFLVSIIAMVGLKLILFVGKRQ